MRGNSLSLGLIASIAAWYALITPMCARAFGVPIKFGFHRLELRPPHEHCWWRVVLSHPFAMKLRMDGVRCFCGWSGWVHSGRNSP